MMPCLWSRGRKASDFLSDFFIKSQFASFIQPSARYDLQTHLYFTIFKSETVSESEVHSLRLLSPITLFLRTFYSPQIPDGQCQKWFYCCDPHSFYQGILGHGFELNSEGSGRKGCLNFTTAVWALPSDSLTEGKVFLIGVPLTVMDATQLWAHWHIYFGSVPQYIIFVQSLKVSKKHILNTFSPTMIQPFLGCSSHITKLNKN